MYRNERSSLAVFEMSSPTAAGKSSEETSPSPLASDSSDLTSPSSPSDPESLLLQLSNLVPSLPVQSEFSEVSSEATSSAVRNVTPIRQSPALRRSSSSLSNVSQSNSREKKRLRFTPFIEAAQAGPSQASFDSDEEDVFFPGVNIDQSKDRRSTKRKGSHRNQNAREWVGNSDPGTPNLQET